MMVGGETLLITLATEILITFHRINKKGIYIAITHN